MRLFMMNDGAWVWEKNGKTEVCQTRKEMFISAYCYEIEHREITFALEQMIKNGHNVAHFGVFGTFIFTEKDFWSEVA